MHVTSGEFLEVSLEESLHLHSRELFRADLEELLHLGPAGSSGALRGG